MSNYQIFLNCDNGFDCLFKTMVFLIDSKNEDDFLSITISGDTLSEEEKNKIYSINSSDKVKIVFEHKVEDSKNDLLEYFKQEISKLYDYTNQRTDIKEKDLYEAISKVYKYLEDLTAHNNSENDKNICFLKNKIESIEKAFYSFENNFVLKANENKEFLLRLVQTKTDNSKTFFEEAVKVQLEIIEKNYEKLLEQQKALLEENLRNQLKVQKDDYEAKLSNQKNWYENELYSQKENLENGIQKQTNESSQKCSDTLYEKLAAQRKVHDEEISSLRSTERELRNDIADLTLKLKQAHHVVADRLNVIEDDERCLFLVKNEKDRCEAEIKRLRDIIEEKEKIISNYEQQQ